MWSPTVIQSEVVFKGKAGHFYHWLPIQGVPRLSPCDSWDRPQRFPWPWKRSVEANGWMVKTLYIQRKPQQLDKMPISKHLMLERKHSFNSKKSTAECASWGLMGAIVAHAFISLQLLFTGRRFSLPFLDRTWNELPRNFLPVILVFSQHRN